jgi:hypothetical protein
MAEPDSSMMSRVIAPFRDPDRVAPMLTAFTL